MYDKQPAAGAGPRALDHATSHPFLRLSLGILLAIALGATVTACGPASQAAKQAVTIPAEATPTHASGGPTDPAGSTSAAASTPAAGPSSASSSPAGQATTPATATPAPKLIAVPQIYGETAQQAAITLSQAGLRLGTTSTSTTAGYERGVIISSTPAQGAPAEPGSPVNVTVSNACACHVIPKTVTVPSVTGDTLAQAESALNQAGFVVGAVSSEPSDVVGQGIVISSSPAGGQQVGFLDIDVTLTVSSGPSSPTGPPVSG
jgi:PASTA domain